MVSIPCQSQDVYKNILDQNFTNFLFNRPVRIVGIVILRVFGRHSGQIRPSTVNSHPAKSTFPRLMTGSALHRAPAG